MAEPNKWIVPLYVYDEITANDTADVLRGVGYLVDPVYEVVASGSD